MSDHTHHQYSEAQLNVSVAEEAVVEELLP